MGATLGTAADLTNSCAVITVLSTLFVMIVFILRLRGEDMLHSSVVHLANLPSQPLPMVAVRNPFALNLIKSRESTLSGVYCEICSQIPVFFQVFWGVDANELNRLLQLEWDTFSARLMENELLDEQNIICKDELKSFDSCESFEVFLEPKVELKWKLGQPPRTKYPLIAVLAERDAVEHEASAQRVVAMICVIHIKDEVVKSESYIYAQYLKQNTGQIVTLKPLYVSSTDDPESTSPNTETQNNCVVCQSEPITRALLPCRHACVCPTCFAQLDKCPMCRGKIFNYFCISKEEETPTNTQNDLQQLNWLQKCEFYMTKMNEFFGFT